VSGLDSVQLDKEPTVCSVCFAPCIARRLGVDARPSSRMRWAADGKDRDIMAAIAVRLITTDPDPSGS
jgi:hypothetical protein